MLLLLFILMLLSFRVYTRKYKHVCDFLEKGQNRVKYLKIWAKLFKIWKYFEKGQPHACDHRMHETARIYPVTGKILES